MPRRPRIDAPGHLYHVMARGIERNVIFTDDQDREVFINRLGTVISETETPAYAFALIPNHFHLLLRRSRVPISRVMQKLLTSYAIYFNKRHNRSGHVFQNRYKSIICDEGIYFLELVRYINLNPVRAHLVETVNDLGWYRYCSHRLIMGNSSLEWFDSAAVLAHFDSDLFRAKRAYSGFIMAGIGQGQRTDLEGCRRRKSQSAPASTQDEQEYFDERILGSEGFIRRFQNERTSALDTNDAEANKIITAVCGRLSISTNDLLGKSKLRKVSNARGQAAFELQRDLGLSASQISRRLHVSPAAVKKMIEKKHAEIVS
ncbi:MAG: transposase [Thermoleophilia bacterium]